MNQTHLNRGKLLALQPLVDTQNDGRAGTLWLAAGALDLSFVQKTRHDHRNGAIVQGVIILPEYLPTNAQHP